MPFYFEGEVPMLTRSLLVLSVFALPAAAQTTPSPVGYARTLWQEVSGYLSKAANDTPDSLYTYRPTPDVRTFGETLDHIAASQNGYCRLALGEKPTGPGSGTGSGCRQSVGGVTRALRARIRPDRLRRRATSLRRR